MRILRVAIWFQVGVVICVYDFEDEYILKAKARRNHLTPPPPKSSVVDLKV